jgi:hypothetical protein
MADAWSWYEALKVGLGDEFVAEVSAGLDKILINPYLFSVTSEYFQKHRISRSPYLILYEIDENVIFVTGIWHTSRKPRR